MLIWQRVSWAAALFSCWYAIPAYAQDPAPASPAPAPPNLTYVEGTVDVVQDGVSQPADPPTMLLDGDVVRTRNGRAEMVFGDGTLMHLSNDTELEVLASERLRLVRGRAIVRVAHTGRQTYAIDTPASSILLEPQGEYGIAADREGRLEVAVTRGSATIQDVTSWTIRSGQMLTLAGAGARPVIQMFNSARWDAFSEWANERTNGYASSYSASQLPYELRPYAPVLDGHGRWDYVAPHGYVWYPSVAVGWRPYYDGSWSHTRFGWTWYGRDRWAWPTHHYGRWGFNGGSWFWIPGNVWAPAWVSWSFAAGYVGWSPLGWDNRPVIWWGRHDHPAYRPNYHHPWRSWTVVRRDHFGPRRNVRAHAIDGERLDEPTRNAFAQAVPVFPGGDVAVPRGSVAGSRDGNVRRPARSYPSNSAAPSTPTSSGNDDTTRTDPAGRWRRPLDNGAYARPTRGAVTESRPGFTPRTRSSGDERRGVIREPAVAPPERAREGAGRPATSPPADSTPAEPSLVVPRDRNGGARRPPPATAPRDGGGDESRGVPRTRPQGAAPPPASRGDAPPPSNGRSGGAVQRDGGGPSGSRAGAPSRGGASGTSGAPRAGGARRPPQ